MLVWVKLVCFPLNFIMLMRTVNIMCISKKKSYYISIFTSFLKLLREIQKDHVQWVLIPIQNIPRKGVRLIFCGCRKGDKTSEFLIFFKNVINEWLLGLYFEFFPNYQKYWKLWFSNVAQVGSLTFFPIHERDGKSQFLNIRLRFTPKFIPSHWSSKIGVFEFPLLSYFLRLWGKSFRHGLCVGEGQPIYD